MFFCVGEVQDICLDLILYYKIRTGQDGLSFRCAEP